MWLSWVAARESSINASSLLGEAGSQELVFMLQLPGWEKKMRTKKFLDSL